MALVTVNGHGVIRGTIAFPRTGAWHAELDVDASVELKGRVPIVIAGGALTLSGTVSIGGVHRGINRVRIVAGADGLRKTAKPKHYVRPTTRLVLDDLTRHVGETVSGTVAASLAARLPAWTVLAASTGEQLTALCDRGAPDGTVWRALPDGTVWMGTDTFPASAVKDWRELDQGPRERRAEIGLDAPTLLPGTLLGEWKLDYIEHHVDEGSVRARVWWLP